MQRNGNTRIPGSIVPKEKVERFPDMIAELVKVWLPTMPLQMQAMGRIIVLQIQASSTVRYSIEAHCALESLVLWLTNELQTVAPEERAESVLRGNDGQREVLPSTSCPEALST